MSDQPWIKFYPRDWRGDQALRLVSLQARGLWMEMICLMHEATPYGHLLVGNQPVSVETLARVVGSTVEETQASLDELENAGVFRRSRTGLISSKRMIADYKRSKEGRKAKLEALEKSGKKPRPSRVPTRPPTTQKPEARTQIEGLNSPSILCEAKSDFLGPKDIRDSFLERLGPEWVASYLDPCTWQDLPERALIPKSAFAAGKIKSEARAVLIKHGLTIVERAA